MCVLFAFCSCLVLFFSALCCCVVICSILGIFMLLASETRSLTTMKTWHKEIDELLTKLNNQDTENITGFWTRK